MWGVQKQVQNDQWHDDNRTLSAKESLLSLVLHFQREESIFLVLVSIAMTELFCGGWQNKICAGGGTGVQPCLRRRRRRRRHRPSLRLIPPSHRLFHLIA